VERRGGVFAAMAAAIAWLIGRPQPVAHALIVSAPDHTVYDPECGVRSVQAADLILPTEQLDAIWDPMHLERLRRSYWRWLSRATLGIVQVDYQEHARVVKALRLIPLLTFKEPEYEMSADRGIVRWRIEKGDARRQGGPRRRRLPRDRRQAPAVEGLSRLVDLPRRGRGRELLPAIASTISRWLYENTQSRIHVLVTHGFLRGLARLDLAESKASASPTSPTCRTPSRRASNLPEALRPDQLPELGPVVPGRDPADRARPRAHDERLGGG
jgi:hypothetical protein